MTGGASPNVAKARSIRQQAAKLKIDLSATEKRHAAVRKEESVSAEALKKFSEQTKNEGQIAVRSGVDFDVPPERMERIRKAEFKLAACASVLPQLASEIAARRAEIESIERPLPLLAFSFGSEVQGGPAAAGGVKRIMIDDLLPCFAAAAAVDVFRSRHASGALSGIPSGGDRPWQSTAVISNFLKALPKQFCPDGLTLETVQREALKYVAIMEREFFDDYDET